MSKKNETLVIGASLKPNRYSNIAIKRLRDNNQTTKAIGLRAGEVEDVTIETTLKDFKNISLKISCNSLIYKLIFGIT